MWKEGWAGERHTDRMTEKDRDKKSCWKKKRVAGASRIKAGVTGKGTGNSTAAQTATGQGQALSSPAWAAPQGTGLLGEADAGSSLPGLPGTLFCNTGSCIHRVWDQMSSPSMCHCLCHPLHLIQPGWFSLPRCPRSARSGSRE